MNFEDLKVDFEYFKESANKADSVLSAFVSDTRIFLQDYCKYHNDDESFIDELSLHLAFFEKYSEELFYYMEYLNNISFFRERQPKPNICYIEDYIQDVYEDEIMFADENCLTNFHDALNKPQLKLLYDFNQDNKDNK